MSLTSLIGGVFAAVLLSFAASVTGQTVPSGFQVQTVVSGLSLPTTMAFLSANEFLVLQKGGSVRHVQLPGPTVTTALTLPVISNSDRGLLGIALHPDFADNHYVYLYYTNNSPLEQRIARYEWNGSTLVSPTIIATLPGTPGPNHDGGIILFGPDGKLYAVIGDLNRDEMTQNFDNGLLSESSVILRLNDDGSTPGDNPFVATAGWERFYAYGVRNSFGLTFDSLTGFLWDTENGENSYDEVNRIVPGTNSGWEDIMGPDSRDPQGMGDLVMIPGAVYVDPELSWFGQVAPTAIRFLESCRWPASLRHDCFMGFSTVAGNVLRLEPNAARTGFVLTGAVADKVIDNPSEETPFVWGTGFGTVTDIDIGPDGYLYFVSIFAGNVYRVRPINPMGDINLDGSVTMADVPLFTDVLLGQITGSQEIALADFDGDSAPTGMDIPCFVESLQMPN